MRTRIVHEQRGRKKTFSTADIISIQPAGRPLCSVSWRPEAPAIRLANHPSVAAARPGCCPRQSCRSSAVQPAFDGPGRRAVNRYPVGKQALRGRRRSAQGPSASAPRGSLDSFTATVHAPFQRLKRALGGAHPKWSRACESKTTRGRPASEVSALSVQHGVHSSIDRAERCDSLRSSSPGEISSEFVRSSPRSGRNDRTGARSYSAGRFQHPTGFGHRSEEHHLALVVEALQEDVRAPHRTGSSRQPQGRAAIREVSAAAVTGSECGTGAYLVHG